MASRRLNNWQLNELPAPSTARALLVFVIMVGITPAGAMWFESSMTTHMLVQLPLLIVLGAVCYQPKAQLNSFLTRIDPLGAIAFICYTGWMLFWMLPLNLDLATIEPSVRLLKLISVPIGIGCCFRWLWHQSNAVLKCVVVFETWASVTRLGWLYIESPLQLCSSYLIGEQQRVGTLLLVISGISATVAVFYSLFGSFNKKNDSTLAKSTSNG